MNILLAGGAGYIGSHTAVALLEAGHEVVVVDNYCNSCPEAIKRVEELTGKSIVSYEADVKDKVKLLEIFKSNKIDCVIHFAGLKAVGESVAKPILYYRNNIDTTLTLLECMAEVGVHNFVFSSSATVYGEAASEPPYVETMERGKCSNPYGWTKSMMEQILQDAAVADKELSVVLLRYFNPIGAHPSGRIGEDPQGIPNNLMPYVSQVAVGRREQLTIFGDDYPTPDGTCRRDYIHVMDLAAGHLAALNYLINNPTDFVQVNLGTGSGYSVLEIIQAVEQAIGAPLPYEIVARRPGDIATCYADPSLAQQLLQRQAQYDLHTMCLDAWRWTCKNHPHLSKLHPV